MVYKLMADIILALCLPWLYTFTLIFLVSLDYPPQGEINT